MKRLQKKGDAGTVQKPAEALIRWLNHSTGGTLVRELVKDAKCVVEVLGKYDSVRDFRSARGKGKVPEAFWTAYERLNARMRGFPHKPQVDITIFYEGEPVYWVMADDAEPGLALSSTEVRCLLRVIEQGSLDKIRSCEYCKTWYHARISPQRFCSPQCRWKAFGSDEGFKAERRAYEKKRYRLHTSGKVVSKTKKTH